MKTNRPKRQVLSILTYKLLSLLLICPMLLIGCSQVIKVPVYPIQGKLDTTNKIPLSAGILIPDQLKYHSYTGKPKSITGGLFVHEFPLGDILELALTHYTPMVFKESRIIRTPRLRHRYDIIIIPTIDDFTFSYGTHTVKSSVHSEIRVTFSLLRNESEIFKNNYTSQSPPIESYAMGNMDGILGQSASSAVSSVTKQFFHDVMIRNLHQ